MWAIIAVYESLSSQFIGANNTLEKRDFLQSYPLSSLLLFKAEPYTSIWHSIPGGRAASATQGPVSQIIRWKGEWGSRGGFGMWSMISTHATGLEFGMGWDSWLAWETIPLPTRSKEECDLQHSTGWDSDVG